MIEALADGSNATDLVADAMAAVLFLDSAACGRLAALVPYAPEGRVLSLAACVRRTVPLGEQGGLLHYFHTSDDFVQAANVTLKLFRG